MNWIRSHKNLLRLIEVLATIGIVIALLFGGSRRSVEIQPWQLGVLTLPWVLFLAAGIPLTYLWWFGQPAGPLAVFRKVTFWFFVSFVLAVLLALYGIFVFQFW